MIKDKNWIFHTGNIKIELCLILRIFSIYKCNFIYNQKQYS